MFGPWMVRVDRVWLNRMHPLIQLPPISGRFWAKNPVSVKCTAIHGICACCTIFMTTELVLACLGVVFYMHPVAMGVAVTSWVNVGWII